MSLPRSPLALVICAVLWPPPTGAEVFCADDATELEAALQASGQNGEYDEVRIAQGSYLAPTHGFAWRSSGNLGDGLGVDISGGWQVAGDGSCFGREPGAWATTLQGSGSDAVLRLLPGPGAAVSVRGLHLRDGVAPGFNRGGGLSLATSTLEDFRGSIVVEGNVFEDNEAHNGGGLQVQAQPIGGGGSIRVSGNLFIGNHARNGFGTVEIMTQDTLSDSGAEVLFIGNTAIGNSAGEPGGSASGGVMVSGGVDTRSVLANNLLWGNDGVDLSLFGYAGHELLHNLVGSRSGFTPVVDLGNFSAPPDFEPCAANCGHWIPASGGNLFDAGYMPSAADGWVLQGEDVAGRPRVDAVSGSVDIGAYENHLRIFADGFDPAAP